MAASLFILIGGGYLATLAGLLAPLRRSNEPAFTLLVESLGPLELTSEWEPAATRAVAFVSPEENSSAPPAEVPEQFVSLRDELIELLDIGDLVTKPVRNLSLGERMKMEIAGALLHRPQVLFLDEPTIGLDITMQRRIRTFIAGYNERFGATVMLTSHYMADVQALCTRVIVIHHGTVLFDGDLSVLADQVGIAKTITARLANGDEVVIQAARADVAAVTARVLADHDVVDLTVEDPPIDDVIEQVFASGSAP